MPRQDHRRHRGPDQGRRRQRRLEPVALESSGRFGKTSMMLGKSVGPVALVGLLGAACMHNVPQDAKSGEDGKIKSARPMKMENNEASAKGIVTYPGGERIDWKLLELPAAKRGTLDLTLSWQPPRPGL